MREEEVREDLRNAEFILDTTTGVSAALYGFLRDRIAKALAKERKRTINSMVVKKLAAFAIGWNYPAGSPAEKERREVVNLYNQSIGKGKEKV